jgi:hypothetical protein
MSAFAESGRQDALKTTKMKGRFRPQAVIQSFRIVLAQQVANGQKRT